MELPDCTMVPNSNLRRLVKAFEYYDEELGIRFLVPSSFTWDGTSVPYIFRPIIGGTWNIKFFIAGLIHDFLYREGVWVYLSRQEKDRIFRTILIACGVPAYRAWEMYYGVRIGGYWSYQQKPINWRRGK